MWELNTLFKQRCPKGTPFELSQPLWLGLVTLQLLLLILCSLPKLSRVLTYTKKIGSPLWERLRWTQGLVGDLDHVITVCTRDLIRRIRIVVFCVLATVIAGDRCHTICLRPAISWGFRALVQPYARTFGAAGSTIIELEATIQMLCYSTVDFSKKIWIIISFFSRRDRDFL